MKKTMRRTKYLLLLLILFISVGYAILQSNLNITGTTGINNAKWDIHWNNVGVTTGSVSGTNVTTPATIDTNKTTVNYNITLSKPGDFYEFTVDAVNAGTIDAMIETISSKLNGTEITTLPNYLNYSVTYSDGAEIKANQELKVGTTETYKVRVEYKKDISVSDLPGVEQTLNLSFSITYKQADDNAQSVIHAVSFAEDDWSTIVAAVKAGNTSNYNVGDTKTVDMGTLGIHTLRIANKSTPAECSQEGFSQTACGFVLEFADIITNHEINSTDTNVGGWRDSEIRTFLNTDIYNALPSELKSGIINTTVVSGHGNTDGEANFITIDKLYLLAFVEIYSNDYSVDSLKHTNSRQLDYYNEKGVTTSGYGNYYDAIKNNTSWWQRSALNSNNGSFFAVDSDGHGASTVNATQKIGISPAFRIG